MIGRSRCHPIALIALSLLLGATTALGVSAADRSFTKAASNFRSGFWDAAMKDFADFVRKYPTSPRVPEAILYQAEAAITNRDYACAIDLLSTNQFRAGPWADQYLFWIGQAHLRNAGFEAAAAAFERLLANFPGSSNCLDSALGAAVARAELRQWSGVIALLQDTNGVFQQAARAGFTNETMASGYLLLGEAQLARTNHAGVNTALESLGRLPLAPESAWRRQYLLCRLQLAQDRLPEVLLNATNLIALAADAGDPRLQAESTALEADVFERLESPDAAITAWQKNLATNVPARYQTRALQKIAELSLASGQPADAAQVIERYAARQPPPPALDLAVLTVGELQLKQYLIAADQNDSTLDTNLLKQAAGRFETVLKTFTNSVWTGRALLGKGWALWAATNFAESEEAFRQAATRPPVSVDQAVARFKWADTRFKQQDFPGALTNYEFLADHYDSVPEVRQQLLERALYQTVRSALLCSNLPAAGGALQKILDWYPDGFAGDRCLLMVGEEFTRENDPGRARQLFSDFESRYPASPLLPSLRLAIARTYEQETNWLAAVTNYEAWIAQFTNSVNAVDLPRAEFSRAIATLMAGQETNALVLLTNFVIRFPASPLAPKAQWCVGDYYFSGGDFYNAERSYYTLYKTWSNSDLACDAQMMAGRAAMAPPRLNYKDAIGYFTDLYTNASCGPDLKIEAAFRTGDAFMSRTDPVEATNRVTSLETALSWFQTIPKLYPTNAQVPRALQKIGDCYLQLAVVDAQNYLAASNAYRQVLALSNTTTAARFQAMIGLATVAEKQARLKTGQEQAALLNLALRDCLEVLNANYNDEPERPDAHMLVEAGLRVGRLAEEMHLWSQAVNVYTNLAILVPSLQATFEKKAQKAQEHIGSAN